MCGEFGLKNKNEIWRTQFVLANIRKRARELLTLEETDERRIFEGHALLRQLFKLGLLNAETENGLDYVLAMTLPKLLERRLQTRVFRSKFANSIHHARTLIKGRHIAVNGRVVNIPSFFVSVENENRINLHSKSPLNNGKPGRRLRKLGKSKN